MIVGVADTHALIWQLFKDGRRSQRVIDFFNESAAAGRQIAVSSISLVEIVYLVEKERIPSSAYEHVSIALAMPKKLFVEIPVSFEIANVLPHVSRAAVPDMPDRIIAATALYYNVPLLTRDGRIRASNLQTIW